MSSLISTNSLRDDQMVSYDDDCQTKFNICQCWSLMCNKKKFLDQMIYQKMMQSLSLMFQALSSPFCLHQLPNLFLALLLIKATIASNVC